MKLPKPLLSLSLMLLLMFASSPLPANATSRAYAHATLPSGVFGPESLTLDCKDEGPYTGVSDGRIFKWEGLETGWTEFATTSPLRTKLFCDRSTSPSKEHICGRPLGLQFDMATCNLYVADAYFGLMTVGPNGGRATPLVSSANGTPFKCTNSVDIDYERGFVYFTDSSSIYQRKDHLISVQTGDATGRLMRYDANTGEVAVLLGGLKFANGVALSNDRTHVLVAETGAHRIRRYWIHAQKDDVFALLPAAPDNLSINANGDVWVALNNGATIPTHRDEVIALRLDGQTGRVLEALHGDGIMESVCAVKENNGLLFVGSLSMPYMGISTI